MYLEKYATDYQAVDFILNGLALILVVGCGLYAVVAHRRKELMARNLVLLWNSGHNRFPNVSRNVHSHGPTGCELLFGG